MSRKKASDFFVGFFILIGLFSLSVPIISAFLSDMNSTQVIIDYEARKFNYNKTSHEYFNNETEKHFKLFDTQSALGIKKNASTKKPIKNTAIIFMDGDMLGYITIPKINAALPIYEGKSDAVLQKGIGHIKQGKNKTCLPFLGKNKNCVLVGHSGLSSARLFSDLDKLSFNDVFYIKVREKYYEYKIIATSIKTPDEAEDCLQIEKNKDICTLVTCTPVPLNSHRLLVKGERIKYDGLFNFSDLQESQAYQNTFSFFICVCIVISLTICLFIIRRKGRKK